jgi:molecular chaperone GrpE (heat shock protein)
MSEEEKSNSKKRKADSVDENRLNYQKQRCEELKEQLKRLENGRFFRISRISLFRTDIYIERYKKQNRIGW